MSLICGWCRGDAMQCDCLATRIAAAMQGVIGAKQVFANQIQTQMQERYCYGCNHSDRIHRYGGCSGVHAIWEPLSVYVSPSVPLGPVSGEIIGCDCRGFMTQIPRSVQALQQATSQEFFRNLLIAAILESEDEMLMVTDIGLARASSYKLTVSMGEDGRSAVVVAEPK